MVFRGLLWRCNGIETAEAGTVGIWELGSWPADISTYAGQSHLGKDQPLSFRAFARPSHR